MVTSILDPYYFQELSVDPDISIYNGIRNGCGQITINCREYPLNISGLRRAFAFAFNKTKVTEAWDGFSSIYSRSHSTHSVPSTCSKNNVHIRQHYHNSKDVDVILRSKGPCM